MSSDKYLTSYLLGFTCHSMFPLQMPFKENVLKSANQYLLFFSLKNSIVGHGSTCLITLFCLLKQREHKLEATDDILSQKKLWGVCLCVCVCARAHTRAVFNYLKYI